MASSSILQPKLCDSCKSTTASLFCNADSAFLCIPCDSKIHAANNLAARHSRVLLCDVCEQAPAHVTCKADAANLCVACDLDIHSANPLARRHLRLPVAAFSHASVDLNDIVAHRDEEEEGEEAEVSASWLISSLNPYCAKIGAEMDSYFDYEYGSIHEKIHQVKEEEEEILKSDLDCVVPVQMKNPDDFSFVNGVASGLDACFDLDFLASTAKPFSCFYNNNNDQSLSNSVSSSSFDTGLVPDSIATIDVSNPFGRQNKDVSDTTNQAVPVVGMDREARVLRYREKRKNRKFEKTIRYASRKAYAETRPRIKGRFVKRTEKEVDMDHIYEDSLVFTDYGIVPTF